MRLAVADIRLRCRYMMHFFDKLQLDQVTALCNVRPSDVRLFWPASALVHDLGRPVEPARSQI